MAYVRIITENTNDEPPIFNKQTYDSRVDENAKPNAIVATVLASDRDGDKVTYSLAPSGSTEQDAMFVVDAGGVIRLSPTPHNFERDQYTLTVLAYDDGSCCQDGQLSPHSANATVIVTITDLNDNKPVFAECGKYQPRVKENMPVGSPVITVIATDKDRGDNGKVTYTYIPKNIEEAYFKINATSGEVITNKVFDRETSKVVPITVIARDMGNPTLEDICVFSVLIEDENDNAPHFDRNEYRETVKLDAVPGQSVFRVSASDADADLNNKCVYSLQPSAGDSTSDAISYFSVNPESGLVSLAKTIGSLTSFTFDAVATDSGMPPLHSAVKVVIDVVKGDVNPPVWEEREYHVTVNESFPLDSVIIPVKATSGITDPRLTYSIVSGSTEQSNSKHTFRILAPNANDNGYAKIELIKPLDYEDIQKYTITMRAQNFAGPKPMASEATLEVIVDDVNDESPEFEANEGITLSVMEGEPVGTLVGKFPATDRDSKPEYKNISYSLIGTEANNQFAIDQYSGEIITKVIFDREMVETLQVRVNITDGAPSARANAKYGVHNSYESDFPIHIGDKNDNNPEFDHNEYNATISENVDVGQSIIAVTASDKDHSSKIRYEITEGNVGGKFNIKEDTGSIYIVGDIDYEQPPNQYTLIVVASDGLHESSTKVNIKVEDVNDNPPKFSQTQYNATIWERKRDNITGLPQLILKVQAEDTDSTHSQKILYYLTGQAHEKGPYGKDVFSIGKETGEIYVNEPLDRDLPDGRPVWQFNVLARDQAGEGGSLDGYAQVSVWLKDINDNPPIFNQVPYIGTVQENQPAGTSVMTMTAVDYDDANEGSNALLTYSIVKNALTEQGQSIFAIDANSALVTTMVANLDRESLDRYEIVVQAQDGGGLTGTGTATILVKDANDNKPHFDQSNYVVNIAETDGTRLPTQPILTLHVADADLPETNINFFSIVPNSGPGWNRFRVLSAANNSAALFVDQILDYENETDRAGFSFIVKVSDDGSAPQGPNHVDTCRVNVTIFDINDNAPIFDQPQQSVSLKEDALPGTVVATFHATDVDNSEQSVISYLISRVTNHNRLFSIDPIGVVKVESALDREKQDTHVLSILAIDDGSPPRTATATLTITVLDVNDNAPMFLEDYQPVVQENSSPVQNVIEVFAKDLDSAANGPPFKFWLSETASEDIKNSFNVQPNAVGSGSAQVSTKVTFDRETQKKYFIPIVIQDSGTPALSSTNTLTVTIGDVNDNDMHPGSVSIFVYNYRGKFPDSDIGRVYVDDKDDWDLSDKLFSWVEKDPNFEMNSDNGTIIMLNGTKEGTYLLKFAVHDSKFGTTVDSNATITVKYIPEVAVRRSGSIRMFGITEEEFISNWDYVINKPIKSKYIIMKETIASLVKVDIKNVDLFTVKKKQQSKDGIFLDIRFSVHGSPYYKPEKLNGLLAYGESQIESLVGVSVTMIGIDECLVENVNCEASCSNVMHISNNPYVVNANRSCLAAVGAEVVAECICHARDYTTPEACVSGTCLNGGTCATFPGTGTEIRCFCPQGFDGPRCQKLSIGFTEPGFAWFPPLQLCEYSHLSLQFMTTNAEGLILYNGPTTNLDSGQEVVVQDFISLELANGLLRLLIDFGSGSLQLLVPNTMLNDEEWHRIDIYWTPDLVRLVIDNCESGTVDDRESSHENPIYERTTCEASGTPPPAHQYLNVNGPLQLGGVNHSNALNYKWDFQHSRVNFIGCIKNVMMNGETYDLASPALEINSRPGCPLTEEKCHENTGDPFCVNGTCVASKSRLVCECRPGYSGERCDQVAPRSTLEKESYIEYKLKNEANQTASEIMLMFRTNEKSGELFRANGVNPREFMILEIQDGRLQYRYDFNGYTSEERFLSLDNVNVSDGIWHSLRLARQGSVASLSLDGGDGRRYNETWSYEGLHQQILVNKDGGVYVGGFWNSTNIVNDLFHSCVSDVRFDTGLMRLPMPPFEMTNEYADAEQRNVQDYCPQIETCLSGPGCPFGMNCLEPWGFPICLCPDGLALDLHVAMCVDINECFDHPCLNGGICENVVGSYLCACVAPFSGRRCETMADEEKSLALSSSALAAIILFALILLVLILALVVYTRRKRALYLKVKTEEDRVNGGLGEGDGEDGGEGDIELQHLIKVPLRGDYLKKTTLDAMVLPGPPKPSRAELQGQAGADDPAIGQIIDEQMDKADGDPDALSPDYLLNFQNEGGGSSVGSLSSLASSGMEDYEIPANLLAKLGPRFRKLAEMYGDGQDSDSSDAEFV